MYTLKHRKKFLIYGLVHLPSATKSFFVPFRTAFGFITKGILQVMIESDRQVY